MTERQFTVLKRLSLNEGRCSTSFAGGWPASSKPTYRALRRLESLGLVDREQKYYWPYWSITPAGRAALTEETGGGE